MERMPHVLETIWRETDIRALEERVRTIDDWLEHTEDLLEMFEADKGFVNKDLLRELRSTAARVRTRKNDILEEADILKKKASEHKE